MPEKSHVPLWIRVLLIALLNLAILAIVFGVFMRMQLRPELESFLMSQARAKIGSVTASVTDDLQAMEATEWDSVLERHSNEQGVRFLLYRNTGEQLAGPATVLPAEVDARMPRGGPPPPPRRGTPDAFDGPARPPFDRRGGDRVPGPEPRSGPRPGPAPEGAFQFLAVTNAQPKYWVGIRMPIIDGPNGEALRSVLMITSSTFFANPFFFDVAPWLKIAAAAAFISALCWLPFVRNLTHAIADMMRATSHIADGRFDVVLKPQRRDELGRLGASINQMAGKLEALTEGRKRFLGAAAHELRSPLARMQLATEILQRSAETSGQKYIDDLKDDIAMMTRLTDELLQFARAESPEPVKLASTSIADAVHAAARQESLDGFSLRIEVDSSIRAHCNKEYLVRSLANVLRNAVRYAGDRGPIEVMAKRKDQDIVITVADCGPGIPADALDKIFTPFYRLDETRDRRTGGTGLGLAIVRTCIEACGGTVECRNRVPSGLEVRIRLPAEKMGS